MMGKKNRIGHFISKILRHRPDLIGAELEREGGWLRMDTMLEGLRNYGYNIDKETLDAIVAEDNKNRYEYSTDKKKIRARRGHSVDVVLDMVPATPPDVLYHGTAAETAERIREEGIKPMNRLYVHLSPIIEYATDVGKRHGRPFVFLVDTKKMAEDGYVFYRSDGVVWLTEYVPAKYLIKDFVR